MDEYISRDAAEIAMCDACEYRCKHHMRASGQSLITADDCCHLRNLYAIPAADVVPVRHGRWIADAVGIGNYCIIYQPVSGTISIVLPNPREQVINELTQTDLENILEVVKELCEKER